MLCQLSYSPKNFGDLAAFARGYSYTVPTEADVYPNCNHLASTCHILCRGLVAAALFLPSGACWRDATQPAALSNAPPAQRDPAPKIAEFGVFDDPRGEPFAGSAFHTTFHPTNAIYMHEGTAFGWRIRLPCRSAVPRRYVDPRTVPDDTPEVVQFREVMTLPSSGDWATLDPTDGSKDGKVKTEISKDGRIATTSDEIQCRDGWIAHSWTVTAHDPPGLWTIAVEIKGYATSTFRATFVGTHATSPATAPGTTTPPSPRPSSPPPPTPLPTRPPSTTSTDPSP
jgi:hypothetical protein